jgi:hypothetical protein
MSIHHADSVLNMRVPPLLAAFARSGDFDSLYPLLWLKNFLSSQPNHPHCSTNIGDTLIVIVCPPVTAVTFPFRSRY